MDFQSLTPGTKVYNTKWTAGEFLLVTEFDDTPYGKAQAEQLADMNSRKIATPTLVLLLMSASGQLIEPFRASQAALLDPNWTTTDPGSIVPTGGEAT